MEACFLHVHISIIHQVNRPEIKYSNKKLRLVLRILIPLSPRLFVAVQVQGAPLPCLIALFTSPERWQS